MDIQQKIAELTEELTHQQAKKAQAEAEAERLRNKAKAEAAQRAEDESLRVGRQAIRAEFLAALGPAAEDPEVWVDLFAHVWNDKYRGNHVTGLKELQKLGKAISLQAAYKAAHPEIKK